MEPLNAPTGTQNILHAEPEDTHKNTEGNHSCDANEWEQEKACHEDPCGDAAMDNGATSDDNTRKINKDESCNSLLAPREEQTTPSIFPSPDGTQERTEEGEDPTSEEENGNAKCPSSTLPLTRMESLQISWSSIKEISMPMINRRLRETLVPMTL